MFRYEILILTIPEITKDEVSTLEFQVEKLIGKFKGSIISFERWGKYRLAYPVRKNDYGVYFLVRFEVEEKQSIINDLNALFSVKFSDIVMRKLVSKFEDGESLEYKKPPSLEDTPKRHISSFLEEKGLLKPSRSKTSESSEKPQTTDVKKKVESSKDESSSSDKTAKVKEEKVSVKKESSESQEATAEKSKKV